MWRADLPTRRPTPLLRDNHRPVELPSCVTPSACLLPVWFVRSTRLPRKALRLQVLSIAGLGIGALTRLAAMGLFLASDEASYVNGQAIPVDGGLTASMPYAGKPI
jgi:NAD(P)-dependent dehydrogenase (short-subunit alcohol dehydrogenase family)